MIYYGDTSQLLGRFTPGDYTGSREQMPHSTGAFQPLVLQPLQDMFWESKDGSLPGGPAKETLAGKHSWDGNSCRAADIRDSG